MAPIASGAVVFKQPVLPEGFSVTEAEALVLLDVSAEGSLMKEVTTMKLDLRLLTGMFLGMVVALHYHGLLVTYLPVLMIATLILVLKLIHH